ncbi:hypothetical protein X975_00794, partial [Stegodyphus mimosarum]
MLRRMRPEKQRHMIIVLYDFVHISVVISRTFFGTFLLLVYLSF